MSESCFRHSGRSADFESADERGIVGWTHKVGSHWA